MKSTPIVNPISMPVASDLSASVNCAVVDTSTGLALPSAGGPISGVLTTEADTAGDMAAVITFGPVPALTAGTFSRGDRLKVDAAGKFVAASATDIAAGRSVARAMEACAASGDLVDVFLYPSAAGVASGTESIIAPGALSVGSETSELSVDGTDAFTLADGYYVGQRKKVRCVVADNTPVGTLTPATTHASHPATYVFTAVLQEVDLEWTATGWKCVGGKTAGADTPASSSTLRPLVAIHLLEITGTDDWILGDGIWIGQTKNIIVKSAASTPAGTVSGLFYDNADGSADATDLTVDAAADASMLIWDGARWFPVGLVSATT